MEILCSKTFRTRKLGKIIVFYVVYVVHYERSSSLSMILHLNLYKVFRILKELVTVFKLSGIMFRLAVRNLGDIKVKWTTEQY